MAPLAVIALAAGTGLRAYGQYQQGKAAEAQAKTEQQILEYNATLKEREAEAERRRAKVAAEQFGREGEALLAEQQVRFAKGGVLTEVGTPALVLEQTAQELDADRMRILEEGYLAGSFRESEAAGLRYRGRAARARGVNVRRGATLAAGGTLLTGIGQAAYVKSQLD